MEWSCGGKDGDRSLLRSALCPSACFQARGALAAPRRRPEAPSSCHSGPLTTASRLCMSALLKIEVSGVANWDSNHSGHELLIGIPSPAGPAPHNRRCPRVIAAFIFTAVLIGKRAKPTCPHGVQEAERDACTGVERNCATRSPLAELSSLVGDDRRGESLAVREHQ